MKLPVENRSLFFRSHSYGTLLCIHINIRKRSSIIMTQNIDGNSQRLTEAVPLQDLLSAHQISQWTSPHSENEGCLARQRLQYQTQSLGPTHTETHTKLDYY